MNDALTNLSIAWQEDGTGRLTVQTIVGSSWTPRGYYGYPDPADSHWFETCLTMSGVIPNRGETHLREVDA